MQLCGVRVEFRRGQSASLTLTPKHLQSAVEPLSDCALQRGPLPHSVPAQLGTAGAQQGEDKEIKPNGAATEAPAGVHIEMCQNCVIFTSKEYIQNFQNHTVLYSS